METMVRNRQVVWATLLLIVSILSANAQRLYVNDKKFPDSRKDLEAIQKTLIESLPKARAATVCIKLKQGFGSGVIISEDGLVLSAAHVTAAVNSDLTIVMEDGSEYKAKSLGLHSETDAAMLQILSDKKFEYVEIEQGKTADEASTKLGDWVFSLGHSGGFDKARGSVVRLGRLVRIAVNTIQSDCTLIGGDSGGPLFDIHGRLIAIHSRVGKNLEQNMHVPLHVYHTHWESLKKGDFIGEGPFASKPVLGGGFIGVAVEQVEEGLRVTDIAPKSPAEAAKIVVGDIIVSINEQAMKKRDDMANFMKLHAAAEEVTLTVIREGGEQKEVKLTLAKR